MAAPISRAEAYVVWKLASGDVADLASDEAGIQETDRVLPAQFIRRLLLRLAASGTDHEATEAFFGGYRPFRPTTSSAPFSIAAPGVRIRNARIIECLDLRDCRGAGDSGLGALSLEDCHLLGDVSSTGQREQASIDMSHANLARVSLRGSRLTHLNAQGVQLHGSLDLTDVCPLRDWSPQPWPGVDLPEYVAWARPNVFAKLRDQKAKLRDKELRDLSEVDASDKEISPSGAEAKESSANDERERPREPFPPNWPTADDELCWINLMGASISGRVILNGARLRAPAPRSQAQVDLSDEHFAFCFERGEALAIVGRDVVVEGGVQLAAAQIAGNVEFHGIDVFGGEGQAFVAKSARIEGYLNFDESRSEKRISRVCNTRYKNSDRHSVIDMYECHLGGGLHFSRVQIDGANSCAIDARHVTTGGLVHFGDNSKIRGAVFLNNAAISSSIIVENAIFSAYIPDNPDHDAMTSTNLTLVGTRVSGNITFDKSKIFGSVEISNISVGGSVELLHVEVSNVNSVKSAHSIIGTLDVSIGGSISIIDTIIIGDLYLLGTSVERDVYVRDSWVTEDAIFSNANVNGGLRIVECRMGRLFAPHISVTNEINISNSDFKFEVDCSYVSCASFELIGTTLNSGLEMSCAKVAGEFIFWPKSISGNVTFLDLACDVYGDNAERWYDSDFWQAGRLVLDGMRYRRIMVDTDSWGELLFVRKMWLDRLYRRAYYPNYEDAEFTDDWPSNFSKGIRTPYYTKVLSRVSQLLWRVPYIRIRLGRPVPLHDEFQAQPYVQLFNALSEHGFDYEGRHILIDRHDVENSFALGWNPFTILRTIISIRLLKRLYGVLFSYGLSPYRAAVSILIFLVAGGVLFSEANQQGALIVSSAPVAIVALDGPSNGEIKDYSFPAIPVRRGTGEFTRTIACGKLIDPFLYAIDVFVPFIDLRQESKCDVGAAPGFSETLNKQVAIEIPALDVSIRASRISLWRYMKAIYAIIGIIITSLATLTFSGILRRISVR